MVLSIGKNKHKSDTTMSKDVKFNINLSVNGKDVVVQCKQGVQELGKALGSIPGKAEQSRQAMIKWSAVSTIYNNLYNGLQQLTGKYRF